MYSVNLNTSTWLYNQPLFSVKFKTNIKDYFEGELNKHEKKLKHIFIQVEKKDKQHLDANY